MWLEASAVLAWPLFTYEGELLNGTLLAAVEFLVWLQFISLGAELRNMFVGDVLIGTLLVIDKFRPGALVFSGRTVYMGGLVIKIAFDGDGFLGCCSGTVGMNIPEFIGFNSCPISNQELWPPAL